MIERRKYAKTNLSALPGSGGGLDEIAALAEIWTTRHRKDIGRDQLTLMMKSLAVGLAAMESGANTKTNINDALRLASICKRWNENTLSVLYLLDEVDDCDVKYKLAFVIGELVMDALTIGNLDKVSTIPVSRAKATTAAARQRQRAKIEERRTKLAPRVIEIARKRPKFAAGQIFTLLRNAAKDEFPASGRNTTTRDIRAILKRIADTARPADVRGQGRPS